VFWRIVNDRGRLFTVPRNGGTPAALQPEFEIGYRAISPDGSRLVGASRNGRPEDWKRWWVIPISGGNAYDVDPPPPLPGSPHSSPPSAWTMPDKYSGQQWAIFGRHNGDTFNLFRVAITSDGKVTSDPEQLTFTTGVSFDARVSDNGRMVLTAEPWIQTSGAYRSTPIAHAQQVTGRT
jgi:hypothetical protein